MLRFYSMKHVIKIMKAAFHLFHLHTVPSNLCTLPMESYLPLAAPLRTSLPWSFWDTISRSASDWWTALSPLAAASSPFCCLSFWGFWPRIWTSFTHWESSASSCLSSFWLASLTGLLLPMSELKRVEPKEAPGESSVLPKKFSILPSSRWGLMQCGRLESRLHFLGTLCRMFTWWVRFLGFAGNWYYFTQEHQEEQNRSAEVGLKLSGNHNSGTPEVEGLLRQQSYQISKEGKWLVVCFDILNITKPKQTKTTSKLDESLLLQVVCRS